jgi:hypothetical protein
MESSGVGAGRAVGFLHGGGARGNRVEISRFTPIFPDFSRPARRPTIPQEFLKSGLLICEPTFQQESGVLLRALPVTLEKELLPGNGSANGPQGEEIRR